MKRKSKMRMKSKRNEGRKDKSKIGMKRNKRKGERIRESK